MFIYSRPQVALRLIALPALMVYYSAKAAYAGLVDGLSSLRDEIPNAVRYVLTGDESPGSVINAVHDAGVTAMDTGRAFTDATTAWITKHLGYRALTLLVLLVVPVAVVWAAVGAFRDAKPLEGLGGLIADLFRDFIAARNPIR